MTDEELVARLRYCGADGGTPLEALMLAAADQLESLVAELAASRKLVEGLTERIAVAHVILARRAEVDPDKDALRAEVIRLKGRLREASAYMAGEPVPESLKLLIAAETDRLMEKVGVDKDRLKECLERMTRILDADVSWSEVQAAMKMARMLLGQREVAIE